MRRVFGLETEYGITLSGAETVDVVSESIELVRRYTDHGALMKWDYDLEDPHLDARWADGAQGRDEAVGVDRRLRLDPSCAISGHGGIHLCRHDRELG